MNLSQIGNFFKDYQPSFYLLDFIPPFLIIILAAWSIFWKGLSLWRSSQNKQKYWFIILLIVNTLGILEIIYLIFFQRKTSSIEKHPQKLE